MEELLEQAELIFQNTLDLQDDWHASNVVLASLVTMAEHTRDHIM